MHRERIERRRAFWFIAAIKAALSPSPSLDWYEAMSSDPAEARALFNQARSQQGDAPQPMR